MKEQIYIPKKLKVGYNDREDTYSKKLAYVIYYDDKGKLRKEGSWKNWIEEEMGIDDFDNEPMEGFVLNRNVGGVRESYGSYDTRIEKVRVYDPRGFEVEIDIANVLFILQECTSAKGKGLEGTFVYGWSGPNLVLLPTNCPEYQQCQTYTALQGKSVGAKELIVGASYKTKKLKDVIYLGKFDWFEYSYNTNSWEPKKKFVFADMDPDEYRMERPQRSEYGKGEDSDNDYKLDLEEWEAEEAERLAAGPQISFLPLASVNNLAACTSETPVSNYAELMSRFNKTVNAGKPVDFVEKVAKPKFKMKKSRYDWWENADNKTYFISMGKGKYMLVNVSPYDQYNDKKPTKWEVETNREYFFKDGKLVSEYPNRDTLGKRKTHTDEQLKEFEFLELFVRLDNNELISAEQYN